MADVADNRIRFSRACPWNRQPEKLPYLPLLKKRWSVKKSHGLAEGDKLPDASNRGAARGNCFLRIPTMFIAAVPLAAWCTGASTV